MVVGLSGIKEWLGQIRAEKDACKYIIYTESMYFPLPFPQEQRETESVYTTCELSSVVVVHLVVCEVQYMLYVQ